MTILHDIIVFSIIRRYFGFWFKYKMYIIASDLFQKTMNAYLRLEIPFVWGKCLAFKYVFFVFYEHVEYSKWIL